jgi:hypothetical protein
MVEMDMDVGEREAEWHEWYLAHIKTLLTVPGFRASQRFKALLPTPAPYLALHQVDSGAVFDSPEYRDRGGPASTGQWRDLHRNWRRNLLNGVDRTPDVPMTAHLVVLDNARDVSLPAGISVGWLTGIGLDSSVEHCGLAVVTFVPPALREIAEADPRVRIYQPISPKLRETS